MIESLNNTINIVNSANYQLNKFLSASAWSFQQKSQPDDLTLSVMHFHSSREAASKYS